MRRRLSRSVCADSEVGERWWRNPFRGLFFLIFMDSVYKQLHFLIIL